MLLAAGAAGSVDQSAWQQQVVGSSPGGGSWWHFKMHERAQHWRAQRAQFELRTRHQQCTRCCIAGRIKAEAKWQIE